jgi:hypothetical protein
VVGPDCTRNTTSAFLHVLAFLDLIPKSVCDGKIRCSMQMQTKTKEDSCQEENTTPFNYFFDALEN